MYSRKPVRAVPTVPGRPRRGQSRDRDCDCLNCVLIDRCVAAKCGRGARRPKGRRAPRPVQVLGQVNGRGERWKIPEVSPDLAARMARHILPRRGESLPAPASPRESLYQRFVHRLSGAMLGGIVPRQNLRHYMTRLRRTDGRELSMADMLAVRRAQPFELSRAVQDSGPYPYIDDQTLEVPMVNGRPYFMAPIDATLTPAPEEPYGGSHLWPS